MGNALWSKEGVGHFWERNKAPFAGDVKASEILRLSRPFRRGRVLDVGSGSGTLVSILTQKGESVVGVDIAPRHHLVKQASVVDLPFSDKSFNTVYATDVLEHLVDDVLATGLMEIRRVMSDDAYFIATVPFNEVLEHNSVSCPYCGAVFHRWGHVQSFSQSKITELLTKSGFRVVKIVALPLGVMAEHWLIQYFWWLFVWTDSVRLSDYFIVVRKK